jgi:hypothetical protein
VIEHGGGGATATTLALHYILYLITGGVKKKGL